MCVYTEYVRKWTRNYYKKESTKKDALVRFVRKVDNDIHRINHYPANSVVCFVNTYPLDNDLAGEQRYPAFEQLRPG